MGRCLIVIKVAGVTSLGLLTGSFAYQFWAAIPDLIRQLNTASASRNQLTLSTISNAFCVSNVVNLALAVSSTGLFTMAYRSAALSGKHPYLLYSALVAPLALVSLYYNGAKAQCDIGKRSGKKSSGVCCSKLGACLSKTKNWGKKFTKTCAKAADDKTPGAAAAKPKNPEEGSLGLSYIHVSEDSLSTTPNTSSPGSPLADSSSCASASSAIEEEVELALNKKAFVRDLETLKSGNCVASAVAAAGLFISTVGVVGEVFYF